MKEDAMKKVHSLFALTVIVLLTPNCRGFTDSENPTSTTPSVHMKEDNPIDISTLNHTNYPRIDGSTSTHPLQITLACWILEVPCIWWENDLFDPTRKMIPDPNFEGSTAEVSKIHSLQHNGTHGAYMNLIEGEADFILVARPPSNDERNAAQHADIELDVRPVALDAFVFLLHRDNPLNDLSLEHIRKIYTGEISQWSELGGNQEKIHTYQRNRNSGSQELMEKLVMRGAPIVESPDMILMSMMGPFNAIREDPQGIGYSVYFYTACIYPHEDIKMILVDGVPPTSNNIAQSTYPLITEVYVVIRSDTPQGSTARLIMDWLLTEEGQTIIETSGYVSIHN
jgi:phosphate transport system substrate-binding protein